MIQELSISVATYVYFKITLKKLTLKIKYRNTVISKLMKHGIQKQVVYLHILKKTTKQL